MISSCVFFYSDDVLGLKKEKVPLVLGIHIRYLVDEIRFQIIYFNDDW